MNEFECEEAAAKQYRRNVGKSIFTSYVIAFDEAGETHDVYFDEPRCFKVMGTSADDLFGWNHDRTTLKSLWWLKPIGQRPPELEQHQTLVMVPAGEYTLGQAEGVKPPWFVF